MKQYGEGMEDGNYLDLLIIQAGLVAVLHDNSSIFNVAILMGEG